MGININKAIIAGNLTRDPEVKALPSGVKVSSFSVATNESYTKDGEKVEKVEFHSVVCFSKLAEVVGQYLVKGQNVLVEGKLQTRSWDGPDGQKRYRTEIVASSVQFGNKPGGQSRQDAPGRAEPADAAFDAIGAGNEAHGAAKPKPAAKKADYQVDKIEYPTEDINPEDIPFN